MSSYHDSFTYKNINSLKDMDLIISSFEPDNGFTDTFLSMDPVFEESYDGTRDFSYGAKYNSKAKINITMIKKDQSDFSMKEFRECAKWLTGARVDSWLDMYVDNQVVYSFLGKVSNLQQYKLDGRTVGLQITFSSVTPWAFSAEQTYDCYFGQELILSDEGSLYVGSENASKLMVDEDGVLYAGLGTSNYFSWIGEEMYGPGVIFVDNTAIVRINNQTDDLYTYINLDTKLFNENCQFISITNTTLGEETRIIAMSVNENILLSSEQFITSSIPNKIFGDNFNFIWPRLAPGWNEFAIYGGEAAHVQFIYRYPMKIGDCTIDVDALNAYC